MRMRLDASALLVSILMRDYRTVGMLTMLLAPGRGAGILDKADVHDLPDREVLP